jgi:photosynthetic reaction center cytochrome c subunit
MIFHMRFAAAVLLGALTLFAQDAKQDKGDKGKGPAPAPTNLKVLKATSRAEVGQIMRTFTVGLGVQCNYCHVQGNNASDDNPKKEIARHMIQMVQQINANFPDGKLHVSCFTCHRGEAEPKTAPEPKIQ